LLPNSLPLVLLGLLNLLPKLLLLLLPPPLLLGACLGACLGLGALLLTLPLRLLLPLGALLPRFRSSNCASCTGVQGTHLQQRARFCIGSRAPRKQVKVQRKRLVAGVGTSTAAHLSVYTSSGPTASAQDS
jgi:hypothetical protein